VQLLLLDRSKDAYGHVVHFRGVCEGQELSQVEPCRVIDIGNIKAPFLLQV